MTIWERMATALGGLGLPVAESVWMARTGQALPEAYLVYFLITNSGEQFADDAERSRMHHVQVSYYSRAGLAGMPDVAGAMLQNGFTRGPEVELPYNELTRHYGLASEFYYLEEE